MATTRKFQFFFYLFRNTFLLIGSAIPAQVSYEFCRTWETFLVILVIYTAWVSPFEFGFLKKPEGPLSIIDNVVNGFFAVDIVLTFFVAYLDKATYLLVDSPKKIGWKYASSWLAFDVISTIPSELARKIPPSPLQSYGFFNMLRLWRLRRVSALFSRYQINFSFILFQSFDLFMFLTPNHYHPYQIGEGQKLQLFLGSVR